MTRCEYCKTLWDDGLRCPECGAPPQTVVLGVVRVADAPRRVSKAWAAALQVMLAMSPVLGGMVLWSSIKRAG